MQPAGPGRQGEARERGDGCPGCGLDSTPARTSGPVVCTNCGYRGSIPWAGEPVPSGQADPEGGQGALRVELTARGRSSGSPTGEDGGRWIRVPVSR